MGEEFSLLLKLIFAKLFHLWWQQLPEKNRQLITWYFWHILVFLTATWLAIVVIRHRRDIGRAFRNADRTLADWLTRIVSGARSRVATNPSPEWKFCRILFAISSLLLILAIGARVPYDFYILLRVLVFGTAVFTLLKIRADLPVWKIYSLLIVALLFNPLIPIHLHRSTWATLNFVCAILMIQQLFSLPRILLPRAKENSREPADPRAV